MITSETHAKKNSYSIALGNVHRDPQVAINGNARQSSKMNKDMMHLNNEGDSSPIVDFSKGAPNGPTGGHVNRMRQLNNVRHQEEQELYDEEEIDEEEILGDDHDYDIEDDD